MTTGRQAHRPSSRPLARSSARLALAGALVLAACGSFLSRPRYRPSVPTDETSRFTRFLEETFLTRLDRDPELRRRLGVEGDDGRWTDRSEARLRKDLELVRRDQRRLRREFDYKDLDPRSKLSYRLFEYDLQQRVEAFEWRDHDFPVRPSGGLHTAIPTFLFDVQTVADREDAEAYLARLAGVRGVMEQLVEGLERREAEGVLPPRFVFPAVLDDCRTLLRGEPFERTGEDGVWLADLRAKLAAASDLDPTSRETLLAQGREALLGSVQPGYQALVRTLERQARVASEDAGVWKLPRGNEYYAYCLRRATTLDLDPEEIHRLGLREVARLHGQLRGLLERVGFEGDLETFFGEVRAADLGLADDSDERTQGLERISTALDAVRGRLGELVGSPAPGPLEVAGAPAWRARWMGDASYSAAADDGSRPARLLVDLGTVASRPGQHWSLLAFHEGLPGRHLQASVERELAHLPGFRRLDGPPAYEGGWALYAEGLPGELGIDPTPEAELGRLSSELWNAARLVVDTGIHQLHWSRQEATDYLLEVTPATRGECVHAVERHAVLPGDATAASIGLLAFRAARERAKGSLGSRFDLSAYHDAILGEGAVPLGVLDEIVAAWIESRRP